MIRFIKPKTDQIMDKTQNIEKGARFLDKTELLNLYKSLVLPRLIEEKMLILLRQGKISKWFSGIGQEAIAVGVTESLTNDEYILPMHRNLGVFTSRKIPLHKLFAQWMGKKEGFTKGRDRSFHFGNQDFKIIGMISHLGPQLGLALGIAYAEKLDKTNRVTVVFSGDGATSEGDFHEAMNIASIWNLPVIFVIESNGYGLSTPSKEQFNVENLSDRAIGYGMKSRILDGNNVLEVYQEFSYIAESIRNKPEPVFVEMKTFRMRGHEEASGTKYVPVELMQTWSQRDPIMKMEDYLLQNDLIDSQGIEQIKNDLKKEINQNWKIAESYPEIEADLKEELSDVYYQSENSIVNSSNSSISNIRLIDAISQALRLYMKKESKSVIFGQDIAEYGGVFKITEGFYQEFGKDRVKNTPICESAVVSAALGMSIKGYKAIVEMQFADFVSSAFTATVNNLAKTHYRWGHAVNVLMRMPTGAGVQAGPFHSQSNEAWFTHTPGLKVVYPAFPYDAKGLLLSSLEEQNPVLFFEHKALYRSVYQDVPGDYYTLELGKAAYLQEGEQITLISYGLGVHWCLDFLKENHDINADLIDLRTLQPIDWKSIEESIKKTNRVVIVQEDVQTGGIASDISAYIVDNLFEYLDAPVKIVSSLDTAVPFSKKLEDQFLGKSRLEKTVKDLLNY
jgi:2-oxoisovalerate dehydrogenase E1 component